MRKESKGDKTMTRARRKIKAMLHGWSKNRTRKQSEMDNKRTCRVCGCTDDNCRQCIEKRGYPCVWVEDDLCSSCAIDMGLLDASEMLETVELCRSIGGTIRFFSTEGTDHKQLGIPLYLPIVSSDEAFPV
jgi:hypothetical protein